MNKNVIFLVGMPGAGKSTIVDDVRSRGIPCVYFGGVTINEVKRRGLDLNEKNERFVREDLRKKEGLGVMAEHIIPEIDDHLKNNSLVVADGLYSWSEYKIVKEYYGDSALIIAITAPRTVRHERLAKRPSRPLNEKEVTSREYSEIENLEKGGPIANADFTLMNNQSPEHLIKEFRNLIDKLLK